MMLRFITKFIKCSRKLRCFGSGALGTFSQPEVWCWRRKMLNSSWET